MPEENLIEEQQAEKRSHRRLLWSFVWLALAIMLGAPLLWSWSVTRKWERLKAEYAAAGETLDAGRLVKKHVPDEENVFGLDELYVAPTVARPTEKLDRLARLSYDLSCALENGTLLYHRNLDGNYRRRLAECLDDVVHSSSPDASAALKKGIDADAPWIPKLLARLDLPEASFNPDIETNDPLGLRYAGNLLYVRGVGCWDSGGTEALTQNLRLQICHLNAAIKTSFSTADNQAPLDLLWVALEENRFTESECLALLKDLDRLEVLQECLQYLRRNAVDNVDWLDFYLVHHRPAWVAAVGSLWPFKDWCQAGVLEPHHEVIAILKANGLTGIYGGAYRPSSRPISEFLCRFQYTASSILTVSDLAACQVNEKTDLAIRLQTKIDIARVALAAELYHFRRGTYPDHIGALVPDFLPAVPVDLIDGKPLRYRLDRSRYRIWSIGGNEVDDGGKSITATMWRGPDHQGDWVWYCPQPPD